MNPYRTLDVIAIVALVGALTWLLGVFGPGLDSHDDEMSQAAALSDAQDQAQREFRRDMASARICREAHGEASFSYTADGQLVCIPRHGRRVLASNP